MSLGDVSQTHFKALLDDADVVLLQPRRPPDGTTSSLQRPAGASTSAGLGLSPLRPSGAAPPTGRESIRAHFMDDASVAFGKAEFSLRMSPSGDVHEDSPSRSSDALARDRLHTSSYSLREGSPSASGRGNPLAPTFFLEGSSSFRDAGAGVTRRRLTHSNMFASHGVLHDGMAVHAPAEHGRHSGSRRETHDTAEVVEPSASKEQRHMHRKEGRPARRADDGPVEQAASFRHRPPDDDE